MRAIIELMCALIQLMISSNNWVYVNLALHRNQYLIKRGQGVNNQTFLYQGIRTRTLSPSLSHGFHHERCKRRPRNAVVIERRGKTWWSLHPWFESHCGTWVQVLRMRLYKPRSFSQQVWIEKEPWLLKAMSAKHKV
jgi:hypothetical protein